MRQPHIPALRRAATPLLAVTLAALPALPRAAVPPGEAPPLVVEAFAAEGVEAVLTLPAEAPGGRLAVVLLVHDLGESDPRGETYAAQLAGAGIATLDLVAPEEGDASLSRAAAALAADGRFDPGRIGVLAFGAAGAAALAAGAGLGARALLYPGCATLGAPPGTPAGTPVLLLHGEADPANPPAECARAVQALAGAGFAVRRIAYAGAGYAWDRPAFGREDRVLLPWPGGGGRIESRPWPALAGLSSAQVAGFFAGALAGHCLSAAAGEGRQHP